MTIGSTPAVMILSPLAAFETKVPKRTTGSGTKLSFRGQLAALANQRCDDDLVVLRHVEIAGLGVERKRQEIEHVSRIESARIRGHERRKVADADNLDAVFHDHAVELGTFDVAALLHGQVDDHGAG